VKRLARSLAKDKLALVSFIVWAGLLVSSIVVGFTPAGRSRGSLSDRLLAPMTGGHLLGTDQQGRDLLVRLLGGVRTEFVIALGAMAVALVIGSVLGLGAGYRGGRLDTVVSFLADVQLSFPSLLIAIVFVHGFGHGILPITIVLGLTFWMIFARTSRQASKTISSNDYIEVARAMGMGMGGIVRRHVLRNVWPSLVSLATIELPRIILGEVSLSFLGFGVSPPDVSLGQILGDGTEYLSKQWWMSTFAGLFVAVLVLAINTFGRWLEGALDPLRQGVAATRS
jgi:peptide/nickel transport system permease protein